MLNPASSRCDYGQLLRPPTLDETGGVEYEVDAAIATTYTLDLNALLVLPVSLVLGNTLEGDLTGEKIALLDAIDQLGGKLKVFYQRGNIHVPPEFNRLFGLLEPMLAPIVPHEQGDERSAAFSSFHPKLWLLRYVRKGRRSTAAPDPERRYRLLVMSRNLTFDRSWDLTASLDGQPLAESARADDSLAWFVESLESFAPGFEPLKSMIRDLRRMQWKPPQPFRDPRMLPGGGAHIANPEDRFGSPLIFGDAKDELLVVSPFLDASEKKALDWLGGDVKGKRTLLSRSDSLDALGPDALAGWDCYALNDRIVDGEEQREEENARSQNLHAKLIVSRSGQTAHWHLGSANATIAALGGSLEDTPRNTEFMLRLSGADAKVGIDVLLRQWTGDEGNHFAVPHAFTPLDVSEQESDRQKLRMLAHRLIASDWKLDARAVESGRYRLVLTTSFALPIIPDGLQVNVGLLSRLGVWKPLLNGAEWTDLALTQLSALVPLQICGRDGEVRESLVIQARLVLPSGLNRVDAVVRELVDTPDKFLNYVRMLLDSTPDKRRLLRSDRHGNEVSDLFGFDGTDALFEQLMRAAARNPDHLERVDELVKRLDKLKVVVPEAFSDLWRHFAPLARNRR
ncbi:phospholipase D family protein [Burkholderia pyrrocinia]|uniref:phospholipase D family protein n=1 Tax=Burkholderia pyrrocinia TaxID=60550 RepID=UPI00215ABD27|nr:phospholipase D family protein [Burkholderia pyrrocinia]UVE66926.1 phospholipase D family protein [Burkholderia pyrrocinia]